MQIEILLYTEELLLRNCRPNETNADRFALLAMEASRTVKEIEPQLSLRIYNGMNPYYSKKPWMFLQKEELSNSLQ